MAVLAPIIAFLGRQLGRLLQLVFGWATLLLFGRVPQEKQMLLVGVTVGSVLWVVTLLGIAFPDIGAFLIALVPAPDFISDDLLRLVMVVLAVIIPLGVGAGGLMLMDPEDRPAGIGGKAVQVLRGYPYAAVLSLVIVFLIVVAPIFKVRSIIKRWHDAHIPLIIAPGRYDAVAEQLEGALDEAGLQLTRRPAPKALELPSKILAAVGGKSVRRLVPDRMLMLRSDALEVMVHPSDIAIAGSEEAVARARAAVADRLATADAYLTSTKESQEIEDAIRKLREPHDAELASRVLEGVDRRLARLTVPYEEWEVLYRQRLQVERDLLRDSVASMDGEPEKPALLDRVAHKVGSVIG
jgi:hypothetical protein